MLSTLLMQQSNAAAVWVRCLLLKSTKYYSRHFL